MGGVWIFSGTTHCGEPLVFVKNWHFLEKKCFFPKPQNIYFDDVLNSKEGFLDPVF